MKEGQPIPLAEAVALPIEPVIPQEVTTPEISGVLFDAKREKDMRHNKNLHGEGKYLDGLTGFYHKKYYRKGIHQPPKVRK